MIHCVESFPEITEYGNCVFLFVKSGGHKILEMYERVKRRVFFSETILGVTNKIVHIKEISQSSTNNFFNYFRKAAKQGYWAIVVH